jgi:hypothetical protein
MKLSRSAQALQAAALAAAVLCLAGAPPGARADALERAPLWAQAGRLSLDQAVSRVQQATGGRVLDARDEGSFHRVKVLTPRGEVRVVLVDARTGAMR